MSPWLTFAVLEVGLVAVGFLVAVWLGQILARRRDRGAVDLLVERVSAGKDARAEALRRFLQQNFDLPEERLTAQSNAILREELRLYQRLANLYLRRDAAAVADFTTALEACVEPYWRLGAEPASGESPVSEREAPEPQTLPPSLVDETELRRLESEVERLKKRSTELGEQLDLSVRHLSRLLDEYSALFDGAVPEELSGPPLIAAVRKVIAGTGGIESAGAAEDAEDDGGQATDEAGPGPDTASDGDQPSSASEVPTVGSGSAVEEPVQTARAQTGDVPSADAAQTPAARVDSEPLPPRTASVPSASNRPGTTEASQSGPAADELMATLDANLPDHPVQAPPLEPALTEAEIDALFDVEPAFVSSAAPGELIDEHRDAAAAVDDRDQETVAIVHQDKREKAAL